MNAHTDINRPWAESNEQRRAREQLVHFHTISYRFDQVVAYLEYLAKDTSNQAVKAGFESLIPELRAIEAKARNHEAHALVA